MEESHTKSHDIAQLLAAFFIRHFSQQKEIEDIITTFNKWFPSSSREKILKEYVAFQVASMVMAIAAHFDDSGEGGNIAVEFSTKFGEYLVQTGIFQSVFEYHAFVDPRVSNYWLASERDEGNGLDPVYWRGKEACKNFSETEKDLHLANVMAVAKIFHEDLIANADFLHELSHQSNAS